MSAAQHLFTPGFINPEQVDSSLLCKGHFRLQPYRIAIYPNNDTAETQNELNTKQNFSINSCPEENFPAWKRV